MIFFLHDDDMLKMLGFSYSLKELLKRLAAAFYFPFISPLHNGKIQELQKQSQQQYYTSASFCTDQNILPLQGTVHLQSWPSKTTFCWIFIKKKGQEDLSHAVLKKISF